MSRARSASYRVDALLAEQSGMPQMAIMFHRRADAELKKAEADEAAAEPRAARRCRPYSWLSRLFMWSA